MRRFVLLLLSISLLLPGCISSVTSPAKKAYRQPREIVRKNLGPHAELAMVLGPASTVQRKLSKEIAGDDGVHPAYRKKFDQMIATFDDKYVESILAEVLKDYLTNDEAIGLSDFLATEKGDADMATLDEQLIDFAPSKQGPAPVVEKVLGPFAKTKTGQKWIRVSPTLQQDFTKAVKTAAIKETRRIVGIKKN